jgi:hypothetical protein
MQTKRTYSGYHKTSDRSIRACGPEKSQRINLGIDIAKACGVRGPLTQQEIAVWCGCTPQAIEYIERRALKKLRRLVPHELLEAFNTI